MFLGFKRKYSFHMVIDNDKNRPFYIMKQMDYSKDNKKQARNQKRSCQLCI